MNFLGIILKAFEFGDRADRYLIEKLKEAEGKFYTKKEFYDECLKELDHLEPILQLEKENRKSELSLFIQKRYSNSSQSLLAISSKLSGHIKSMQALMLIDIYSVTKAKMIRQIINRLKRKSIDITDTNNQLIKTYIWDDKELDFIYILNKFYKHWQEKKHKKELIYLLHYLMNEGFFREYVEGKKLKSKHGKDFLSLYFYKDKLSLSNAKKMYYNNITKRGNHLYTILHL